MYLILVAATQGYENVTTPMACAILASLACVVEASADPRTLLSLSQPPFTGFTGHTGYTGDTICYSYNNFSFVIWTVIISQFKINSYLSNTENTKNTFLGSWLNFFEFDVYFRVKSLSQEMWKCCEVL